MIISTSSNRRVQFMTTSPAKPGPQNRFSGILPAVLIGLPLAAGLIALVRLGPFQGTVVARYLSHPVEYAEVILFSAALGLLAAKLGRVMAERLRLRRDPLPPWDGRPVGVAKAPRLLAAVNALPRSLQRSALGKRVAGVLDFLCSRGSADQLDDHLRDLADADSVTQENGHGLVKLI